jgi:hypothetical protein
LLGFAGTRDDDIVAASIATTHVLKGGPAPAPFNIKDKGEALRLLVHYIGDSALDFVELDSMRADPGALEVASAEVAGAS